MPEFGNRCAEHEDAGAVIKLDSSVKNWEIGDCVGIKHLRNVCGLCEHCHHSRDNHCPIASAHDLTHPDVLMFKLPFFMYLLLTASEDSFQEYITTSTCYTRRIRDNVSDDLAAPLMCAGITAYRSLMESNYSPGNWVAFPGGGGVGIMAVQFAKVLGLRAIVIDTGDKKESAGLQNGAEAFLDFQKVADIP